MFMIEERKDWYERLRGRFFSERVALSLFFVPDNKTVTVPTIPLSKGFRFCAMIGPHIPESVLEHHNEFHAGPRPLLPCYGTHDQGIWLPER